MKLRRILIVCCSFLFADSVYARSVGATAGPDYSHLEGRNEPAQPEQDAPLIMELKFDGNNITGTVTGPPNPGDLKTGTYDPKTWSPEAGS